MRQYRPAERATAQGSEAPLSGRFGARSRRGGRRHQLVIADATARARERPPSDAKRLWSAPPKGLLLDAKRLWSAPPKGLLPDAKRLWSAEIHLRFQVAHYSYTVMCISRGDARLESGAEVGFAAPPGSALQGCDRVISTAEIIKGAGGGGKPAVSKAGRVKRPIGV